MKEKSNICCHQKIIQNNSQRRIPSYATFIWKIFLNNSASATTFITLIWISSSAKLMAISKRQDAFKTNGINWKLTRTMCSFYFKKMQCFKLTRRKAHPVGVKARIAANKSDIVSPHTTNKTVMTDMKPRNRSALRILNMSWKSVPNLRLPIDTIW